MTATLLLVMLSLVVISAAAAFLAYLVVDAGITERPREALIAALRNRDPAHRLYERARDNYDAVLADYSDAVNDALATGKPVPADPPEPPAEPDDPPSVKLLTCRTCAGTWTSLVCTITARCVLAVGHPALGPGVPWHWTDPLLVLAVTCASAYVIHHLAVIEYARDEQE